MNWGGSVLPAVAIAVAALMTVTWVASVRLHDVSIVDPIWGPAFALTAVVAALVASGCPGRRLLIAVLIGVWGLRLGAHLTARKLGERGEDRRYQALRAKHPHNFPLFSLVVVFGLQGLLVLLVSLPVQLADTATSGLSWVIAPGIALYLLGLGFELVGDEQLRRFKARPESSGQVMDQGLWRLTRHPNYFGDACVWWGIWLVALPAGGTWWTAIGPVVMTWLLVRGSGAALLEKDIGERRPGYAEYIRRTSGFLPRPPRD
jgi:steroid 5-alpha reductase family enzyme